jgi:hypothetical protein
MPGPENEGTTVVVGATVVQRSPEQRHFAVTLPGMLMTEHLTNVVWTQTNL